MCGDDYSVNFTNYRKSAYYNKLEIYMLNYYRIIAIKGTRYTNIMNKALF